MCHHQSPPSAPSVTAHTSSTASDSIIVPHYSKQQEVPKERESSIGALPSSHVDSLFVPSAQIWEESYGQLKDPEAGDKTTDVPSLTPATFSVSQSSLQPGGSLFDFTTLVTLVPCSHQLAKDLVDLPISITESQFTGTEFLNRSDNVNFPQQDWLAKCGSATGEMITPSEVSLGKSFSSSITNRNSAPKMLCPSHANSQAITDCISSITSPPTHMEPKDLLKATLATYVCVVQSSTRTQQNGAGFVPQTNEEELIPMEKETSGGGATALCSGSVALTRDNNPRGSLPEPSFSSSQDTSRDACFFDATYSSIDCTVREQSSFKRMSTTFQSSFPKFGVSEQSNNRLRSVAVETKVRDEMEDLNVLHFQQGVLSIASAFYVDLATLVVSVLVERINRPELEFF